MEASGVHRLNERYTDLSDRFRSLWTFYQFLGGVYKHRGDGTLPFSYDFQALHRRLQGLVTRMGREDSIEVRSDLDNVERELGRIRSELSAIEARFPPSTLRRFFDHLKRQDEKILFALVKFYLQAPHVEQDTLDKLDILLTRLAEAPLDDGRVLQRDRTELQTTFERLAEFAGIPSPPRSQVHEALDQIRSLRGELTGIHEFQNLVDSRVYDRFREMKQRLGSLFLYPEVLVELISTNIEAKNRFKRLYQEEEVRILEDTNRVFEVERYLEKNPDLAHAELQGLIDRFRMSRERFDTGRREDNIKKEDILDLRKAMHRVLETFDPARPGTAPDQLPEPEPLVDELTSEVAVPDDTRAAGLFSEPEERANVTISGEEGPTFSDDDERHDRESAKAAQAARSADHDTASLAELLPTDPLLNETLHTIMFALELVVWDRDPEQATHANELHHLQLEPWEIGGYRGLARREVAVDTFEWHLYVFFLTSAALRVRMVEELREITRLAQSNMTDRVMEVLERSAQSLERAREVDRRFAWFIDDMLFRGATDQLEQIYRSRFRFLHAWAALWLEHQEHGGVTPL